MFVFPLHNNFQSCMYATDILLILANLSPDMIVEDSCHPAHQQTSAGVLTTIDSIFNPGNFRSKDGQVYLINVPKDGNDVFYNCQVDVRQNEFSCFDGPVTVCVSFSLSFFLFSFSFTPLFFCMSHVLSHITVLQWWENLSLSIADRDSLMGVWCSLSVSD